MKRLNFVILPLSWIISYWLQQQFRWILSAVMWSKCLFHPALIYQTPCCSRLFLCRSLFAVLLCSWWSVSTTRRATNEQWKTEGKHCLKNVISSCYFGALKGKFCGSFSQPNNLIGVKIYFHSGFSSTRRPFHWMQIRFFHFACTDFRIYFPSVK